MTRDRYGDIEQRLLMHGADSLSDTDILSVLLGSSRLASKLLPVGDRWSAFDHSTLITQYQLSHRRAAQVLALIDLARRLMSTPLRSGQAFRASDDVFRAYGVRLRSERQERFIALGLDARNRVISEHDVARGGLTAVDVDPRVLFGLLLRVGAVAAIAIHNHPSGDPEPSADDHALCDRIRDAGSLLGVTLLDFIVIGHERYVSFADRGWQRNVADRPLKRLK